MSHPAPFHFAPIPPADAADLLATAPAATREVFAHLLPELKARAFTLAGLEAFDTIAHVRQMLREQPPGEWAQQQRDLLHDLSPYLPPSTDRTADPDSTDPAPQTDSAERHAELLLRTHGTQAYSAAAWHTLQAQRAPYWQYQSLGDGRVRPSHAALDGIVLPAGSHFWESHFPPWEWGCRCQVLPLSAADVAALEQSDAALPPEQRRVLTGEALAQLETHGLLTRPADLARRTGPPTSIDVRSDAQKGQPGAFRWRPGDLRLTPEQLQQRYAHDPQTWAAFQTWAKSTQIPEQDQTVQEWMENAALAPQSQPAKTGASKTFDELLAAQGLDTKTQWTEQDVQALLAALKKPNPVSATKKIVAITGSALKPDGFFSKAGLQGAMQEVLDLLPPAVAKKLPPITLIVEPTYDALGEYDTGKHALRLNFAALSALAKTDPNAPKETLWHELMHWIHLNGPPEYSASIRDHFRLRTVGEPTHQLPGYEADVEGREDQWWEAYAGRIYPGEPIDGTGMEVPTRYFQLLANPAKLLRQFDPGVNKHAASFLPTLRTVMEIFQ